MGTTKHAMAVLLLSALLALGAFGVSRGLIPTPWFLEQSEPKSITELQVADWIEEETWVEVVAWERYENDGGTDLVWYFEALDSHYWANILGKNVADNQLAEAMYQAMSWAGKWGYDGTFLIIIGECPGCGKTIVIGAIYVSTSDFNEWKTTLVAPPIFADIDDLLDPRYTNLSMHHIKFECELPECTLHE